MECKFSDVTHEVEVEVNIDAQIIPKKGSFKYLGFIIQENGEIDVDVARRIGAGRQNGGSHLEYCDKNVLARLKGKFYRVVVPILLYGTWYWPTKNVHDEYSGDEDTQINV